MGANGFKPPFPPEKLLVSSSFRRLDRGSGGHDFFSPFPFSLSLIFQRRRKEKPPLSFSKDSAEPRKLVGKLNFPSRTFPSNVRRNSIFGRYHTLKRRRYIYYFSLCFVPPRLVPNNNISYSNNFHQASSTTPTPESKIVGVKGPYRSLSHKPEGGRMHQ